MSDMSWVSSTNGFGPAERDMSNGENLSGDGQPIQIDGTVFEKGLGCHANSEIIVALDGNYQTFKSISKYKRWS
ncbi:MAG: NPCBM/NEW2 domain-containing protein [Tannerellaceae bacterium]|nr:NPCBM/NEW2 domain-containing protein [Tannerellaceae bacterium]